MLVDHQSLSKCLPFSVYHSVFMYTLISCSHFRSLIWFCIHFLFDVFLGTLALPLQGFFVSTAAGSFGEKCVTLALAFRLLPKPRRSCFKMVLTGNLRPVPSGPRPVVTFTGKKENSQNLNKPQGDNCRINFNSQQVGLGVWVCLSQSAWPIRLCFT